jgi:hypothetical protein
VIWPLHTHRFELVSRTYAPPTRYLPHLNGPARDVVPMLERQIHGATTLTWKCADPSCGKVVQAVSLGKETTEAEAAVKEVNKQ